MDQLSNKGNKYDLEERTAKFAEEIIDFVRTIKQDVVNRRIIDQLVGSAGSTGANYCEAVEAESKKDFIHDLDYGSPTSLVFTKVGQDVGDHLRSNGYS